MNRKHMRLVKLARALDEFDRNLGPVRADIHHLDMTSVTQTNLEKECGTSCCALGLAALHPDFTALEPAPLDFEAFKVRLKGKAVGWDDPSLKDYFGISYSQYLDIFDPWSYLPQRPEGWAENGRDEWAKQNVRPVHVIVRIRSVLSAHGVNLDDRLAKLGASA